MDDKKFDIPTFLSALQEHLVYILVIILLVFVIIVNYTFYTKNSRIYFYIYFTLNTLLNKILELFLIIIQE